MYIIRHSGNILVTERNKVVNVEKQSMVDLITFVSYMYVHNMPTLLYINDILFNNVTIFN